MRSLIPTTSRIPLTVLVATGVLLSGCGETTVTPGDPGQTSAESPSTRRPRIELTIERDVSSEADGSTGLDGFSPGVWTLTCDPVGGDHPDPEAACAALEEAGIEVFAPVPEDQPCTMIYGGPETATVTGRIGDTEVNAEFSRTNGCEIDRWERLSPLLNP
ncbi:hypothetical protein NI17_019465 [Thermobifida halotolerans]|uniref:Uncharacterized protein n=1 Tax=Thermobifida halotolerans TaxID=483545 RepID=A0A399FVK9_9ACTN|nr:SSI family serine proteinase inhibitor [Thermobifida halotolerans]UOE18925.1 hypothetical protein NI17_019465 [Thermobifida halotolerans]